MASTAFFFSMPNLAHFKFLSEFHPNVELAPAGQPLLTLLLVIAGRYPVLWSLGQQWLSPGFPRAPSKAAPLEAPELVREKLRGLNCDLPTLRLLLANVITHSLHVGATSQEEGGWVHQTHFLVSLQQGLVHLVQDLINNQQLFPVP